MILNKFYQNFKKGMLKNSGSQKGSNYTKNLKYNIPRKKVKYDEKSKKFDFSFILKPFCYEQTEPLEVPTYDFGFVLPIPKLFSYPLEKGKLFKKSS